MAYHTDPSLQPFAKRLYLSSPTMHGEELQYMTEAYETNWMSTAALHRVVPTFREPKEVNATQGGEVELPSAAARI